MKSYYQILGIDKTATQQDIKKAYRKLAMQHHPDKNDNSKQSQQIFKQLCQAYQVLSDKEKRQQYDMFGKQGSTSTFDQMFRGGFGFGDIFENIFNHQNPFAGGKRVQKSQDIVISVQLNLVDTLQQKTISQQVDVKHKCSVCNGTKSQDGIVDTCPTCNGTGIITNHFQIGPGMYGQQQHPCEFCNGTGKIVKNPCTSCLGTGYQIVKQTISVNIPKGIQDNVFMRIQSKGNHDKDIAGDLIVNIHIIQHELFIKQNNHLIYKVKLPYYDLLLGKTFTIKDLENNDIQVIVPSGTNSPIIIKQKGTYSVKINNSNTIGDLYVIIQCVLPNTKQMNQIQLQNLRKIRESYNG